MLKESPQAAVGPGHHVVKDVEGGLRLGPFAHPQFLQQHGLSRRRTQVQFYYMSKIEVDECVFVFITLWGPQHVSTVTTWGPKDLSINPDLTIFF